MRLTDAYEQMILIYAAIGGSILFGAKVGFLIGRANFYVWVSMNY